MIRLIRICQGGRPQGDAGEQRRLRMAGITAVVITVVALLASAALYVIPIGDREHAVELATSGGLESGDEVRIGGVPVGEVRSVTLSGTHVRATFGIDAGIDLGHATAAAVKMRTPLGGRFLLLTSTSGSGELPGNTIPLDRTSVPYVLGDLFNTATEKVGALDEQALAKSLNALNRGFDRQALNGLISNMKLLTGIAAGQSDLVRRGLDVGREYTTKLANEKQALSRAIEQLAWASRSLGSHRKEIVQAFWGLKEFLRLLDRVTMAYADELEPVVVELTKTVRYLSDHKDEFLQALTDLQAISEQLIAASSDAGLKVDVSPVACSSPEGEC